MTEQLQSSKPTKGNSTLLVVCAILALVAAGVSIGVAQSTNKHNQEVQAKAERDAAVVEKQAEARKAQLATCIKAANDLYAQYTAKTPTDSSASDKIAYTQTITQLWNSNKSDCDRQYGSNP